MPQNPEIPRWVYPDIWQADAVLWWTIPDCDNRCEQEIPIPKREDSL